MKSRYLWVKQNHVEIRNEEVGAPGPGEVLLKTLACGICGSDIHSYYDEKAGAEGRPGHEPVAEVMAVGPGVSLSPGQRVAIYVCVGCGSCEHCETGMEANCDQVQVHGFGLPGFDAECVLASEKACLPLPEGMPADMGVLVGDVLGVSMHQLIRLGAQQGETLAVFGLGPMGLGAVAVGRYLGLRVLASETLGYRRALAKALGAEAAIDPLTEDVAASFREATAGKGPSIVIEAAGVQQSLDAALACVAKRGRVGLIAEWPEAQFSPSNHFHRKQLTMIGSTYYSRKQFSEIVKMIQSCPWVGQIITHRFPLDRAKEAFDVFKSGETGKVIFQM